MPHLSTVDWIIIAVYGAGALALGAYFTKQASKGVSSFFVGDRKLPWWIAGTSIVATTFAADTPLAVTGIVATGGISGNWIWWCWGIAHLTATFLFARMWRRSGVITDAEITELRYGGRPAAMLRGFKALYFGIFINCLTMAWVIAAMVKISRAFFDVEPALVIALCVGFSVVYTTLGGFRSVVITDLVQFCLGMAGAIALAIYAAAHFGGIGKAPAGDDPGSGLLAALAQSTSAAGTTLADVVDFVPGTDHPTTPLILFVVLLVAGWWRYAEGSGPAIQRLAACRSEGDAQGASLWFAVAHNALRPWPWIVVALAALVVYPQLPKDGVHSLQAASPHGHVSVSPARLDIARGGTLTFVGLPNDAVVEVMNQVTSVRVSQAGTVSASFGPFPRSGETTIHAASQNRTWTISGLRIELLDREMGYPLLLGGLLPSGLLGLVIASLLAAFMSTIDTHTNWGASYLVRDVYQRFIRPSADERHYVLVSRLCIVLMGILAGLSALFVHSIAEVWTFLVTLGAGLGSVTAARWYWHRVTPHAEFAALGVTTVLAIVLQLFCTTTLFGGDNPWFVYAVPRWAQIVIIASASLCTWVPVSLLGPRNDPEALRRFALRVRPPGTGWRQFGARSDEPVAPALLRIAAGAVVLYGSLFGIGYLVLGSRLLGVALLLCATALLFWIIRTSPQALEPTND